MPQVPSEALFQEILNHANRLLASQAMTRYMLQQKLLKRFAAVPELIEKVLINLEEAKVIDDQRFAENYLRYRAERAPRGTILLRIELKRKGISNEIIDAVLMNQEQDSGAQIRELLERKWRTFAPKLSDAKKREKVFRFLLGRGFRREEVFKALDQFKANSYENY